MGDICLRVGIKMRAALVSAVAKKAFTMASVKKELTADIVAFVASDIHKVFIHFINKESFNTKFFKTISEFFRSRLGN
jgi:hypothetical protein